MQRASQSCLWVWNDMNDMKIPKGEVLWTRYGDGERITHIITSKADRTMYFLYAVGADKSLKRVGKAKFPVELEEKYLRR